MLKPITNEFGMSLTPQLIRFSLTMKEISEKAMQIFYELTGEKVWIRADYDEEYTSMLRLTLDFNDEQRLVENNLYLDCNFEDSTELTDWMIGKIFGTEKVSSYVGDIRLENEDDITVWFSIHIEDYFKLVKQNA